MKHIQRKHAGPSRPLSVGAGKRFSAYSPRVEIDPSVVFEDLLPDLAQGSNGFAWACCPFHDDSNPRGILVEHDELTGLLAGFERPGREGKRQGYLTAWNGTGSHRVDRIGRGNIFIEHFCASIFGGIQPDKLELYLAEAQYNHGNDGFIQRLQLMVYPFGLLSGKSWSAHLPIF